MNNSFEEFDLDSDLDVSLKIAAEDFNDDDFQRFHYFSNSDNQILRRLMVHGPVLLRGPRGCGKSAYMRQAHNKIKYSNSSIASAYISLRHLPLLRANADNYLEILIPFVSKILRGELLQQNFHVALEFDNVSTIDEFNVAANSLCLKNGKRLVLLFDDVAHIGREVSLGGFFDFFRTISSNVVSCKASIYPGVTRFGSRFDIYNDATVVEAQRDERSSDFPDFFGKIMHDRYFNLLQSSELRLKEFLPFFIGRAVLGNVRAFNAFCNHLASELNSRSGSITIHRLADALKWYSNDYLYPALEELETKLGSYVPVLRIAQELSVSFFSEAGRKRISSILIHRDNINRLGKIFEILEYSGFIAKREASKALHKGGRGPRYVLSLGSLFEQIPGGATALSYDLLEQISGTTEAVEYPIDSSLKNYALPDICMDSDIDAFNAPIKNLLQSKSGHYGLTQLMIDALASGSYNKIGDVAGLSIEDLDLLPGIGITKARRIRHVVEQSIWM